MTALGWLLSSWGVIGIFIGVFPLVPTAPDVAVVASAHTTPAPIASSATDPRPAASSECIEHKITIAKHDTLLARVDGLGMSRADVLSWIGDLSATDAKTLRSLRPGDRIEACVASTHTDLHRANDATLVFLRLDRQSGNDVTLVGSGATPTAGDSKPPKLISRLRFVVQSDLSTDLEKLGIARSTARALAACVRYDRDLPELLPEGTPVTLLYTAGKLMHAQAVEIEYHGRNHKIYRYDDARGRDLLVDEHGRGVMTLALQRPVASRRITSGWGWRTHPILGTPEFHKGVDYGAAMGTPVKAAADGMVTLAAWHGNYGRLVEIQHAGGVATRYGHLSRFARRIHRHCQVKAGDIIGYVGQSGLATGPHLYFELYEGKRRLDPSDLGRITVPVRLSAAERRRLSEFVHSVEIKSAESTPLPAGHT